MLKKRNCGCSVLLLLSLYLTATIIWLLSKWNCRPADTIFFPEYPSRCNVYQAIQMDNRNITLLSLNWTERNCSSNEFLVPNVVHFVWFGDSWNLTFLNYMSFLSVHKVLSPAYIFIHGENIPIGYWWNETKQQVANIYHVYRKAPTTALNGQPFKFIEHRSDLARLQIVQSK